IIRIQSNSFLELTNRSRKIKIEDRMNKSKRRVRLTQIWIDRDRFLRHGDRLRIHFGRHSATIERQQQVAVGHSRVGNGVAWIDIGRLLKVTKRSLNVSTGAFVPE